VHCQSHVAPLGPTYFEIVFISSLHRPYAARSGIFQASYRNLGGRAVGLITSRTTCKDACWIGLRLTAGTQARDCKSILARRFARSARISAAL
jgi:hypothetical protein